MDFTQMSAGERNGRSYCRAINADPDELVRGRADHGPLITVPRWFFYRNAHFDITVSETGDRVSSRLIPNDPGPPPARPVLRLVGRE